MAKYYDYTFILVAKDPYSEGNVYLVKGVKINGYPSYSVLAGQDMICYIATYGTLEEAQKAWPDANLHNEYTAPRNYVNHLPDTPDYDW